MCFISIPVVWVVTRYLDVVAQARKPGFKLKALLSFAPSKFETECFQARVKLAPPHLDWNLHVLNDRRIVHLLVFGHVLTVLLTHVVVAHLAERDRRIENRTSSDS